MAKNLILRSFVFRRAIENRLSPLGTLSLISTTRHTTAPHASNSYLFSTAIATIPSPPLSSLPPFHHFSSVSSASGPSNIVLVKSEEEFNDIFSKVQDKSVPAIFYFTAVWCGPCRFISPVIGELGERYPHVTIYKIDIDQEAIQGTLGKLQITSVPTFHFFQNGKKADELIGADVARLKHIVEKLFG